MALRWSEGFESHSNTAQWDRKYATRSGAFAIQAGRVFGNGGSLQAPVWITPSRGLADTWGIAFGVNFLAQVVLATPQGIYLEKATTEQVHLEFVNSAGSFEVRLMRGATQLGITSQAFAYGAWHHFELKVTIHPSTGSYELRHNEVNVLSGSGVNTANAGTSQADIFALRFTTTNTNARFDDIWVWDGTGSLNNDFGGDAIIEEFHPNGAGNSTQWTPSAGSNFDNVDDSGGSAPDDAGAGGFNGSDTNGQKDLYALSDLVQIQGNILGVFLETQMAMAASGSRQVKTKYRDDGGSEADGATHSVAATVYDTFIDTFDQNPATATPWDVADINGGQFGVEVVS